MNEEYVVSLRVCVVLAVAVALGACATFSQDGGFGTIQAITQEKLGKQARWQRGHDEFDETNAIVQQILKNPLSVEDAVQIALLNNRGLQATYAELGIAEADLVQAGRPRNPHFSMLRTKRGGQLAELEQTLSIEVISLLTLPLRTKLETRRFERVQRRVTEEVLRVAHETRNAYYKALAAQETARYMAQVVEAAEASAELSRRMAQAGNFPKLTHMREHVFYAEAVAQLARARHHAVNEREKLTRLMGLYGEDTRFTLPDRLPSLPAELPELRDIEANAIANRLDVDSAKRETANLAQSLGLTRATRFINVLELGRARTKGHDDPFAYGYELSIELPIFDWGSTRVAKAEALYMQALQRVAEVAINARSEVRESYSASRTAYDTAKHYRDEIVPLRKRISEENLLLYNGMLISVFELLADAREQVMSVNAYIEALRDFWLAESALQMALTGTSSTMSSLDMKPTMTPASGAKDGH